MTSIPLDTIPQRRLEPWRLALMKAIHRDGRDQWAVLAKLSRGEPIIIPEVSDTGKRTGRMRVIRPTAGIMLKASESLLDRAFGKPIQTVIAADVSTAVSADLIGLAPEDVAELQRIAAKRLLRAPHVEATAVRALDEPGAPPGPFDEKDEP